MKCHLRQIYDYRRLAKHGQTLSTLKQGPGHCSWSAQPFQRRGLRLRFAEISGEHLGLTPSLHWSVQQKDLRLWIWTRLAAAKSLCRPATPSSLFKVTKSGTCTCHSAINDGFCAALEPKKAQKPEADDRPDPCA